MTRADARAVDEIEKLIARKIDYAPDAGGAVEADVEEAPEHAPRAAHSRGRPRGRGRERGASRGETEHRGESRPRARERAERAPSAERGHRPQREQAPRPAPSRAVELPAPVAAARRSHASEPHEERVIGLGDHVPSFLLRPTRAPRPAPVEAED